MKLFDVYPLFDISIERGRGCYVYDSNDNEYLDLYGGHAVISVGHSHPFYIEKISSQITRLGFYSNSVVNPIQEELAFKLGRICGYDDYFLFLINSGAEANENALKLASFHNGRKKVLAFKNAFHGRTSAAVATTDISSYSSPINTGLEVCFAPFNDIEFVKKELTTKEYSSVIIEGIQGVAGVHIPDDFFLQELRKVCTETETVLILDEIQSGCGRSGKFFAHQYAEIKPDIITVAKGIANGFPMAGVVISPIFKAVYGQLGTTFGGNHLGCAAAIATIDIIAAEELVENSFKVGEHLMKGLSSLAVDCIKEIRGRGLMIGIELDKPIKEIRDKLLFEEKIFTGSTGSNIFRLLPPLSLTTQQANFFLDKFEKVLKEN